MMIRIGKTHFLVVGFLTILIMLTGCQTTIEPGIESEAIRPRRLVGLNGRPLINPQAGNCTLDQLEAREEGFRALGGVGGLAVNHPASLATPVAQPSWVSNELSQIITFGLPRARVGVIVLDDFKGGAYTLDERLYSLEYADLGGNDEEKTAAFEAYLDELIAAGGLSHGAMVMEALADFIYHMPGIRPISVTEDKVVFRRRVGVHRAQIVLQAVDTQEFNTSIIANNLKTAIQAMANSPSPIRRFVVNMSFSIVPCSVLDDYRQSDIPSYEEYIKELAQHNNLVGFEQQILELTLTPLPNDPLEFLLNSPTLFAAQTGAENITLVASSGNYQLPYALSPARLSNVIAVGSLDVLTNNISSFTNHAQVMASGAWLNLTDDMNRNGVGSDALAIVEAGTSFAGPAAAAFLALDLTRQVPKCALNVTSRLTQVPENSNAPIDAAVGVFCP